MVGAAMVEFAIVLVLLVLIVFGITELGRALYQQNSLTKAVNIGSRFIARQYDLLHPAADCTFKDSVRRTQVEQQARNLIICGRLDCSGFDPVVPGLTSAGITIATMSKKIKAEDEDENEIEWEACVIEVTAVAPFIPIFGDVVVPLTNLAGFNLNARTEDRYIGE
jgi:hypothetical protein